MKNLLKIEEPSVLNESCMEYYFDTEHTDPNDDRTNGMMFY